MLIKIPLGILNGTGPIKHGMTFTLTVTEVIELHYIDSDYVLRNCTVLISVT